MASNGQNEAFERLLMHPKSKWKKPPNVWIQLFFQLEGNRTECIAIAHASIAHIALLFIHHMCCAGSLF